jgi:hypothetical protein
MGFSLKFITGSKVPFSFSALAFEQRVHMLRDVV